MKKRMLSLALMTIFISLMALGSAAYFTVEGRATNIITTGTVSFILDEHLEEGEWTEVKDGDVTVAYQFNDLVMPGVTVKKNPTILNDGTEPFWLRVKVEISVEDANGKSLPADCVQLLEQGDNWTSQTEDDGWNYYTDHVNPDDEITIFNGVKLAEETPNEYQSSKVSITVQAQAVQVKNNNPADGVLAVEGWPAESAE